MSRIRTNLITNRMANGAPTVSNGLVISGVTTTSDIKVGTGVTLNVYGGATFSGIVTASSFSGIDTDKISEGNTEAEVVDTGSDGHFKVTTEGSERLRITSAGLVGIGTDTPYNPLAVVGSSADIMVYDTDDYSQNVSGGAVAFAGKDSAGNRKTLADVRGVANGANIGEFAIRTRRTGGTLTEALRIDSSGNVGFGTNSPDTKVHIYEQSGSGSCYLKIENNRSRNAAVQFTTTQGSWYVGQGIGVDADRFMVYDSQQRMAIDSSGNMTLNTGNLVMGTSGKGIDFSADGSGTLKTLPNSLNAELLHDYENGTFTPSIQYDTGTNHYSGSNVSSAVGEYIRIGDLVSFGMKIILTGNRNYSQNIYMYIGGLPYNGMHTSQQSSMMSGWGGWVCPTNDSNSSYQVHNCKHSYTTVDVRFEQSSGTGGIDGFYAWGFYRTAP